MEAEIILNKAAYGIDFIKGKEGDRIHGYSFYEIKNNKEDCLYITSRITEKPILEAVTDEQYKSWKNKDIIAKKAVFIWDKNMWRIEDYL